MTSAETSSDLSLLDEVLQRSVVLATGIADAAPRPQQRALTHEIWDALSSEGGHSIGEAPTGTGKSLAYLAASMVRSARYGERSVISTESLSLQAQVVDKDAPVVAEAIEDITGQHVSVALLKGWSNYVCLKAAAAEAEQILGIEVGSAAGGDAWSLAADQVGVATTDVDVLTWALRQGASTALFGDRHTYPDRVTEDQWGLVSVSPSECVGVKTCPFAEICKPALAKLRAADADIIVTNHALLAVQAAHRIAAVVGSKALGPIDNIIVDEAHALPGQVRSQGAGEVSARRVIGLVRAFESTVADSSTSRSVTELAQSGRAIADMVTAELSTYPGPVVGGAIRLKSAEEDPTEDFSGALDMWITRAIGLVKSYTAGANEVAQLKARRFKSRAESLQQSLEFAAEHRPGVARWLEQGEDGTRAVKFSPVDVAMPLASNLWSVADPDADGDDHDDDADLSAEEELSEASSGRLNMSVAAVSATLPPGFGGEAGLRAQISRHTSPLTAALHGSALFVPPARAPEDIAGLAVPGTASDRKPRFDTGRHYLWAAPIVTRLVQANGGRALVLASTAAAGRFYAERLREINGGHFHVIDQWGQRPLRQLVDEWRADETSVLVGTRSLMTGVDAPGDTCSLVILDRVPRAPSNPVDDARVEDLMARIQTDKWTADRQVYVSDAALLLKQAAGRLVRRVTDRGLVAVLDPRLRSATGSVFNYQETTRKEYLNAIGELGSALTNIDEAAAFIASVAAGREDRQRS